VGYDTVSGERGVTLPGTEQRLCIARVFLKNPPILILDEATSALDNATEIRSSAPWTNCARADHHRVAHRLSTVMGADEIAVISEGRITEQGSHDRAHRVDAPTPSCTGNSSAHNRTIKKCVCFCCFFANFFQDTFSL
jgi:ATP-binding cassette subfamily B protein